jgi:hypothetical protein
MRMISLLITFLVVLLPPASLAQQSSGTSTPTPQASDPSPKGYTGAYAPPGTPPTPYSTGPLPTVDPGPGLDKVGPDGSTKSVKAVPCRSFAQETDGSTTCVGISDENRRKQRR